MNDKKFLKYCIKKLDFTQPDSFERYYSSVGLCAINSIFSINTKYEAVLNVIHSFCTHQNIKPYARYKGKIPLIQEQNSVSEIHRILTNYSNKELAENIFQNKQRTSSKSGILKAEAVVRFLKILKDFRVEYYQDVPYVHFNETFEECIKRIPGQKSGISLRYFFMLTGSKNFIKPDRMIMKFIEEGIGKKLTAHEALLLIRSTVKELIKIGYTQLNPRYLDNLIWSYQRSI